MILLIQKLQNKKVPAEKQEPFLINSLLMHL